MPRSVSDAFREAFSASSTDQVALVMLEVGHATMDNPIRVVLDTVSHGFGETTVATTLSGSHAATPGVGLEEIIVADHANFSVGDNIRVEEDNATATTLSVAAAAAATNVKVASATGLSVHDPIKITLDSGTDYRTIRKVSGTTVTIDTALSGAAASGKAVDKIGWSHGKIAVKDTAGGDRLEFKAESGHAWTGGSGGNAVHKLHEYLPFPFEIELGSSEPGSFTGARLKIDNVDRSILAAFRSIKPSDQAAEVSIRIVLASTPETVEFETPPLAWRSITYDTISIQGELSAPSFFVSAFPAHHFTPTDYPNLFSVA